MPPHRQYYQQLPRPELRSAWSGTLHAGPTQLVTTAHVVMLGSALLYVLPSIRSAASAKQTAASCKVSLKAASHADQPSAELANRRVLMAGAPQTATQREPAWSGKNHAATPLLYPDCSSEAAARSQPGSVPAHAVPTAPACFATHSAANRKQVPRHSKQCCTRQQWSRAKRG